MADTAEDDESPSETHDSSARAPRPTGASSGGVGTSDGELGDSWRMNPLANEEEAAEGNEGENLEDIAGGAGVLGLIQQFQKANTDGRRTTVGI